ncbi:MAG: TIGR04283 family arsenosugar biosynthesis glycosyltransferase [Rhodothermaceae bacterium]|nr:TIGR04283 family arsenosugar biosynthesis glycosyltransferase [Rhodothermaceae bacterium]
MLSIIIPTLNEAASLPILLQRLKELLQDTDEYEILVCDGGSTDDTARVACEHGATLVTCARSGRAFQMDAGAKAASGTILYFLHADTLPPTGFHHIITGMVKNGAESGCFRLSFEQKHPMLYLYSWFTRFKTRYLRFGDQSLFVKKQVYEETGGFDTGLIVMEDFEFAGRLIGRSRFVLHGSSVVTSARKYRGNGIIRLQLMFTMVYLMYLAGVSQQILVHFYRSNIR